MANKRSIYNADKFSRLETYTQSLCFDLNKFVATVKGADLLHIDLTDDFARQLVETQGSNLMEGLEGYLKPILSEIHPFLKDSAKKTADEKRCQLANVINNSGIVSIINSVRFSGCNGDLGEYAVDSVSYDKTNGSFLPDVEKMKKFATTVIGGDKLAFYERVEKVVEELNSLREECVGLCNYDYLFAEIRCNGFIDRNSDGKFFADPKLFDIM